MKQRRLGNTGVLVSELCLGAMNFGMADRVSRPSFSYPARFIHVSERNRLDVRRV